MERCSFGNVSEWIDPIIIGIKARAGIKHNCDLLMSLGFIVGRNKLINWNVRIRSSDRYELNNLVGLPATIHQVSGVVHGICARRLAFIVEKSGAIIDENDGKPKNTDKNHLCIKKHLHEGGSYENKKRQEERRWVKRVIWKIAIAGANCWIIFSNYETSNRKLKRRRLCPTEMRNNGNAWCCHRLCNNANYYNVNNIFIYAHLHTYIHTLLLFI